MLIAPVLQFLIIPAVILLVSLVYPLLGKLFKKSLKKQSDKTKRQIQRVSTERKQLEKMARHKDLTAEEAVIIETDKEETFKKELALRGKQATLATASTFNRVLMWVTRIISAVMFSYGLVFGLALIGGSFAVLYASVVMTTECTVNGEVINTSPSSDSSSSSDSDGSAVASDSLGQGEFTEEASNWAKSYSGFTFIGDSLGVGVEPKLKGYFPNSNFNMKSSRAFKHSDSSLSGIDTLKGMSDVKEVLVIALGTNQPPTTELMDAMVEASGGKAKNIVWVTTASEGGGSGYNKIDKDAIAETIKDYVSNKSNMVVLDWNAYVQSKLKWSDITSDSVHMNDKGYEEYAKFLTQGLYDYLGKRASGFARGVSTQLSAEEIEAYVPQADAYVPPIGDEHEFEPVHEGKIPVDENSPYARSELAGAVYASIKKIRGADMEKFLQSEWDKPLDTANNPDSDWEPHVARVRRMMVKYFGYEDLNTYVGHQPNQRLAIDFMTHNDYVLGDTAAAWLIENIDQLGIDYIIWGQKFYMNIDNIYGPAKVWSFMPDRGSWTQNHGDHVHISFKEGFNLDKNVKLNDTGSGGNSDGQKYNGVGSDRWQGIVGQEANALGDASFNEVDGSSDYDSGSNPVVDTLRAVICANRASNTSSTSDTSSEDESSSDDGGAEDGSGTVPADATAWGYKPADLPDSLKPYIIDPAKYGLQYGGSGGFVDNTGQCVDLTQSFANKLWGFEGTTTGNGIDQARSWASKFGNSVKKKPKRGAIFSHGGVVFNGVDLGHTGIVSHVFEDGSILVVEQNTPLSGASAGLISSWNFRIFRSAEVKSLGMTFAYPDGKSIKE